MTTLPTVRQALVQCGLVPVDAQVLLAHLLGRDRAWLVAHAEDALLRADADRFFALAKRRRGGEPVAYLIGWREFWGLRLAVDASVLIPRPETETLVELALARLAGDRPLRVLDLGTGSGAVALAIAHERPQAQVLGVDCSASAIAIARRNAQRLGLENATFAVGDWYRDLAPDGAAGLAGLPDRAKGFELIASNPPYVAAGDPHLVDADLRCEPAYALVAGSDGLDALRMIIAGAPRRLVRGGHLVVEHGYDQADAVRDLFGAAGFVDVVSARDLAGIARVVGGRVR